MAPHIVKELSKLTVKEMRSCLAGSLSISSALKSNKAALLEYVVENVPAEQLEFLLQLTHDRRTERSKKHEVAELERNEQQNACRIAQRPEDTDLTPDSSYSEMHFLQLPNNAQVKDCYHAFYKATSNSAVATAVCGICARLLDVITNKLTPYPITSLPNVDRLVLNTSHSNHTLVEGKLLDEKGVQDEGSDAVVMSCFDDLKQRANKPPKYSLVNNMWIGEVSWQLQTLTFPEQMLISLLYPQVYMFKLYPKKIGGTRDASTLQRGIQGNVSLYELNMDGIPSMLQGNLMPCPPAVLVLVISWPQYLNSGCPQHFVSGARLSLKHYTS